MRRGFLRQRKKKGTDYFCMAEVYVIRLKSVFFSVELGSGLHSNCFYLFSLCPREGRSKEQGNERKYCAWEFVKKVDQEGDCVTVAGSRGEEDNRIADCSFASWWWPISKGTKSSITLLGIWNGKSSLLKKVFWEISLSLSRYLNFASGSPCKKGLRVDEPYNIKTISLKW